MHIVSADYRILIILIPQNRGRHAGGLVLAERNLSDRDDYRGVNDRNVFFRSRQSGNVRPEQLWWRRFIFFFENPVNYIRWVRHTHNTWGFSGWRDHYYRIRTENGRWRVVWISKTTTVRARIQLVDLVFPFERSFDLTSLQWRRRRRLANESRLQRSKGESGAHATFDSEFDQKTSGIEKLLNLNISASGTRRHGRQYLRVKTVTPWNDVCNTP